MPTEGPTQPRLAPHHLADLRRSGLSDETIAAAGLYSLSAAEAQTLLRRSDVGSAMAIPYHGCTFSDGTPYVRVRLDVPLLIGGHEARYLTRKGERNRLYVPPVLPPSVLTDASVSLAMVEGEKKALKACQDGIPCVGLAGVWCWKTKVDGKSVPLPDLDVIAWRGRETAIVFDSDLASKPDLRRARSALAKELTRRGTRVRLPDLRAGPHGEKVGLDDFLLSHSASDYQLLVEAAPLWRQSSRSGRSGQSEEGEAAEHGSQADRLVALALAEGVELFHDHVGDAFALVPVGTHRETWPCRGKGLKRWLAGRLWQAEGKAANTQALGTALNVIEAKAFFEGAERELSNRVARSEGEIWYDLADRDLRPDHLRRARGGGPHRGHRQVCLRGRLPPRHSDVVLVGLLPATLRQRGGPARPPRGSGRAGA